MPCMSYGDEDSVRERTLSLQNKFLKAALCAAMKVIELHSSVDVIDYKEGGFSKRRLLRWWENHKREDKERKEREELEKNRNKLKKSALEKLTPEERSALGL